MVSRTFDILATGCYPHVPIARNGAKRSHSLIPTPVNCISNGPTKMNLNEYMVTLEKPLGIRFALSRDGKIFVHSLKRGGNADMSRIVMVGDTLKKAGDSGKLSPIENLGDTERLLRDQKESRSLVLERPFTPFPIHQLHLSKHDDLSFNRGRVAVATFNNKLTASNLERSGHCGFVTFSPKFLSPHGWNILDDATENELSSSIVSPLICLISEGEADDENWTHGNFPLDEYMKALERSKDEVYYNNALGMRYSKITEHIYVGSCIQTKSDVDMLSKAGVSAVINFQSRAESDNWGVDSKFINDACNKSKILMVNFPIRDGDSFDMRKKLPYCVGLMLRLLKKNHRVFVTCTTGFDRSPSCVVAYLHWMTDTSLNAAYNFVTALHSCKPDRAAIAWATWDLIGMVENGRHDGSATHSVTFVWNGHEGEEVYVVGDFTGNWKEPLKMTHKGGCRYEAEVRVTHRKYYYKYIVNGQWRHSNSSPTERDERGNINNYIVVGDFANDVNVTKVIERSLSENERFMLAKAARCVAFSVCPIKLTPKSMYSF